MTEDQIKAIAEEVAHLRAFDGGFFPKEKEIREDYEVFLQWLNEKYCIVEREKVMEAVKEIREDAFPICEYEESLIFAEDAISYFKSLFGTSMFNQDEE